MVLTADFALLSGPFFSDATSNLNSDFVPCFEVENQMLILVNHNVANNSVPERVVKFQIQLIQFIEGKQASADFISLDLPPFFVLLECIISGLQLFKAFHQGVIAVNICSLIYRFRCVFIHQYF